MKESKLRHKVRDDMIRHPNDRIIRTCDVMDKSIIEHQPTKRLSLRFHVQLGTMTPICRTASMVSSRIITEVKASIDDLP